MKHTLSVVVEDRPGALTRITTMFARRGFNIESLAVGPTERPGVSSITLRVDCTQHSLEQIEKQIHKLVNVLRVTELVAGEAVERELLVVRVQTPPERRAELVTTAEALGGRLLDVGTGRRRPRADRDARGLDAFHELCHPYGIVDLVRTGRIGVPRASAKRKAPRRLAAIYVSRGCTLPPPERTQRWRRSSETAISQLPRRDGGGRRLRQPGPRPCAQPPGEASGVRVAVGLREGSSSWTRPKRPGSTCGRSRTPSGRAARLAAAPRPGAAAGVHRVRPAVARARGGRCLFAHGFNVLYGRVAPAAGHDVVMVAPRALVTSSGACSPKATDARRSSPSSRTRPGARGTSRSPTRSDRRGVRAGSSKRRSARRPRPTCSASRPSSAAAPPS